MLVVPLRFDGIGEVLESGNIYIYLYKVCGFDTNYTLVSLTTKISQVTISASYMSRICFN